jgi:hypothetical protein
MARPSTIETHPECRQIEAAMLAGEHPSEIAQRFAVSQWAIIRHREKLPTSLGDEVQLPELPQADTLLGQVQELRQRALTILDRAEEAGDLRTALGAIREARSTLALLLEVEGRLNRGTTVNVLVTPEWHAIRGVLLAALDSYPDARLAVAAALERMHDAGK